MSDTNKVEALSILKGLLSKAYKMDDGKINELFDAEGATTESVLKTLEDLDVQRVASLKKVNADNKDSFNQGYAKATKEQRSKFEEEIKAELGIESESTGIDLVKEIAEDGVIHVYSNETGKDVAQIPLTKLAELEKEVKDFVEYKLSAYKVANPTKRSNLLPKSIYAFDIPNEIARVKRYKEYAEYCLKQLEQMQKEG